MDFSDTVEGTVVCHPDLLFRAEAFIPQMQGLLPVESRRLPQFQIPLKDYSFRPPLGSGKACAKNTTLFKLPLCPAPLP